MLLQLLLFKMSLFRRREKYNVVIQQFLSFSLLSSLSLLKRNGIFLQGTQVKLLTIQCTHVCIDIDSARSVISRL